MPRGGARPGAGRPKKSDALKARSGNAKLILGGSTFELIGPSPRRQLLHFLKTGEGSDPGVRTDGGWFAEFTERFCTLTKPPNAGEPFVLEPHERAFFDDALKFDDAGRRVYTTALAGWPRKQGKTTTLGALSLAQASSAEGEPWPDIPMAAGSRGQAGELFGHARAFVEANTVLAAEFDPLKTAIERRDGNGTIWRIAADGKLQHSLNPYVVIADELHAWTTPKQEELYAALKTAFGARDDGLMLIITTAGWDKNTILGQLYTNASEHPDVERRADMGSGGFVLRDKVGRVLVHWYGISPGTTIDDLDDWAAANPASWRTRDRIAADLADPSLDESSKRRLYGNQWTAAKNAWITPERWAELRDPAATSETEWWIPEGALVTVGADAAVTYDTTAVGWAWMNDGKCHVRARVWSARQDAPHHVLHPGRIDNEAGAEAFVRDELLSKFSVSEVAYDPRYFEDQAKRLAELGPMVFPVAPDSKLMREAINGFYRGVVEGTIVHDGDPILAAHVAAAVAVKTEAGSTWKLDKGKASNPMDALIAVILAAWRAMRGEDGVWVSNW